MLHACAEANRGAPALWVGWLAAMRVARAAAAEDAAAAGHAHARFRMPQQGACCGPGPCAVLWAARRAPGGPLQGPSQTAAPHPSPKLRPLAHRAF